MVGVPAAGKSTIKQKLLDESIFENPVTISTDDIVEDVGRQLGLTYDKVWQSVYPLADSHAKIKLMNAFSGNRDIVWDQTNVSPKSRIKKLRNVPKNYRKIAFWLPFPDEEEWQRRLANRPGKTIPEYVRVTMTENFSVPELSEGFDFITNNILQIV